MYFSLPAGIRHGLGALLLISFTCIAATPAGTLAADKALALAMTALQNNDFEAVVRILGPVMPLLDTSARAWRTLGLAQLKLHHGNEADAAYAKALRLDPDNAQLLLYLGIAAAQRGDVEQAFQWLQKARSSGRVDMTQLDVEPDAKVLRADARYAGLLPRALEFTHPFVEDVRVLHEWDGEAAGDQFGWIARVIGDVDGDGVNDFVTSAPTKDLGGENAGRIYVYSGRTGALLWSVDGAPGDELGSGIEAAGDTNGDGIPDVIGSAPGGDTAYVYSGRDGHVLLRLHGEAKGDRFGEHVSSVGDIDGDGYSDVIVGAPSNNAGGKGAGRAYVYSGRDGHLLLTLTGQRAGDAYGSTVAGYSDGTHRFIVVGAPGAGAHKRGRVFVYKDLSAHPAFVIDPDPTGVALGYMFVSVLGDVDGDGVPDIFASDWADASRGPSTGKTYVYSGRTGKRLYMFRGDTAGEGFGTTHSVAGDVNGDGRADIIVGAWQYGVAAPGGGRAYLFDGRTGQRLRTYTDKIVGDTFGFDAVGMGTLDDKGQSELLITSGWSAIHGYHSGRIFLISSGVERQAVPGAVPAAH